MTNPAWEKWEIECQDRLGLRSTVSSGSQFYDPSDGVDPRSHNESDYLLMIDAKCTESQSYRVQKKLMNQWVEKARMGGYRFALPIRLDNGGSPDDHDITDFAVITFEDFLELVESYREKNDKKPAKSKKSKLDEDDMEFVSKIAEAIKPAKARARFLDILERLEKP